MNTPREHCCGLTLGNQGSRSKGINVIHDLVLSRLRVPSGDTALGNLVWKRMDLAWDGLDPLDRLDSGEKQPEVESLSPIRTTLHLLPSRSTQRHAKSFTRQREQAH